MIGKNMIIKMNPETNDGLTMQSITETNPKTHMITADNTDTPDFSDHLIRIKPQFSRFV